MRHCHPGSAAVRIVRILSAISNGPRPWEERFPKAGRAAKRSAGFAHQACVGQMSDSQRDQALSNRRPQGCWGWFKPRRAIASMMRSPKAFVTCGSFLRFRSSISDRKPYLMPRGFFWGHVKLRKNPAADAALAMCDAPSQSAANVEWRNPNSTGQRSPLYLYRRRNIWRCQFKKSVEPASSQTAVSCGDARQASWTMCASEPCVSQAGSA